MAVYTLETKSTSDAQGLWIRLDTLPTLSPERTVNWWFYPKSTKSFIHRSLKVHAMLLEVETVHQILEALL